jgi:predicted DNA-binding protein
MSIEEKVSITISINKEYRDRLRTMAARQNLHDPDQLTSASTIAREIICEQIDEIDRIEADFVAADNAAKSLQEPEQDESSESATDK